MVIDKWDLRFLNLAAHVAQWSKDPSTKVGAVIVRPDRTIASVGFNGFPRGCDDDDALYADRARKYPRVVHGEMNAMLCAHEELSGYTQYLWPFGSCSTCAAAAIQKKIGRVVYIDEQSDRVDRWRESLNEGLKMFAEAGVMVSPIFLDGEVHTYGTSRPSQTD